MMGDTMSLSQKKVAIIHVAKKQLALEDEGYRAVLQHCGGVTSAADLDDAGFQAVMTYFERCGFQSTSKKANFGNRPGMASPGQVAMIRRLWGQFTAGEGTDATLGKWLNRQFKVSAIRFLPVDKAPKVITALKAMVEKKAAPAASSEPAAPTAA